MRYSKRDVTPRRAAVRSRYIATTVTLALTLLPAPAGRALAERDLVFRQPVECIGLQPIVPPTPASNLVDGDELTYVKTYYNFDCIVDLPGTSTFRLTRISWNQFTYKRVFFTGECREEGVGEWNLYSSMDRVSWKHLAGTQAPLITPEQIAPISGEGRYVKLKVDMAQCPPIGAHSFSVFGYPSPDG